jgi:transposase
MRDWLSIDVAKLTLAVALQIEGRKRAFEREFDNDAKGLARLVQWLSERGAGLAQLTVVMEATGVYHESVAQLLHDSGCRVIIANPARVRDYARGIGLLHKTDKVDTRALLRYGQEKASELVAWTPPPSEVRTLRALYGRLAAVQEDLQREENRRQQALIAQQPVLVIDSLDSSVQHLQQQCRGLQRAIEDHFDQHPPLKEQRKLLQSIPSIGAVSGDLLLCLLLSHQFKNARQAAAFCGLIPRTYQSGTSVHKPGKLTKQGDAFLRAKLYMPAVVALKHNARLRKVYDHLLQAGKCKLSALCAIMRHLVHIAYGVLKHKSPYNPDLSGGNA